MTEETHSSGTAAANAAVARQRPNGSQGDYLGDDGRAPESWLDRVLVTFGLKGSDRIRESLEGAFASDEVDQSLFSTEEQRLLQNIFELRDMRISDVMVPRADIEAVDQDIAIQDLLRLFREAGHSRLPVYRETLDDPIGFVHIKDVMAYITDRAIAGAGPDSGLALAAVDLAVPLSSLEIVRPLLFVPPSMRAVDLMVRMRASHVQLALVIDEYGGTDGVVTLEDLVETIIGDIEDEYDEDEPMLQAIGEGAWIADARLPIEDFEEETGLGIDGSDYREEVDTLGGLIFALVGRVPVRGEVIASDALPAFAFEVLDADPRRINRLKIERRDPRESERDDASHAGASPGK